MPPVVRIARQLYTQRVEEVKDNLKKDEEEFGRLAREIELIKNGQWDQELQEQLPTTTKDTPSENAAQPAVDNVAQVNEVSSSDSQVLPQALTIADAEKLKLPEHVTSEENRMKRTSSETAMVTGSAMNNAGLMKMVLSTAIAVVSGDNVKSEILQGEQPPPTVDPSVLKTTEGETRNDGHTVESIEPDTTAVEKDVGHIQDNPITSKNPVEQSTNVVSSTIAVPIVNQVDNLIKNNAMDMDRLEENQVIVSDHQDGAKVMELPEKNPQYNSHNHDIPMSTHGLPKISIPEPSHFISLNPQHRLEQSVSPSSKLRIMTPDEEDFTSSETATPTSTSTFDRKKANANSDQRQKAWQKNINLLWQEIANHKNGTMFMNPIKKSYAPLYDKVVKQPLYLKTIKNRVRDGVVRTTAEFERDVVLMLTNSLMYNKEGTEMYLMALEMLDDVREQIRLFKSADGYSYGNTKCNPPKKKTVDTIPRDESTRKRIIDIIDHQFDLEIYLKQREVATIKREIAKAESVLEDLKLAVENESLAASMPEASHFTRRSAMYYHGGSQALLNQNLTQPPLAPKRKVYRTSEKSQLFGRRQDGVYVRLTCPVCHRDDFANQQGFLNHCRISHNLEFGPYEQVMIQAGTPVDESEVPLDNPARLRPIMNLNTTSSIPPPKKLERPSIKVFEEDVDMEVDNERKASANIDNSQPTTPIEPETVHTNAIESPIPVHPVDNEPNKPVILSDVEMSNNLIEASEEESSLQATESDKMEAIKEKSDAITEPKLIDQIAPTHVEEADTKSKDETGTGNEDASVAADEKPETPKVKSFAAVMHPTADAGYQIYIKRRIIVGNVSKFLNPEGRDPELKQFTHKWMIYVVEPPQSKQEVSAFITGVRFHLHPSYKPHDVVDVTEAPFKLTRLGWGEFPIRVQLFFVDKKRNKTVDSFTT
ncbi:unnamed protein product [Mucor hiemalis]